MMIEHLGGLSYKDGLVCWSTINMIFCGDLIGSKLRNVFKLLPNGATLGICAGNTFLPFSALILWFHFMAWKNYLQLLTADSSPANACMCVSNGFKWASHHAGHKEVSRCHTRGKAEESIGVFPKWIRNSANSRNLINHWSMNWAQFKDPFCYMCLAGTVVASWSLRQKVGGLNNLLKI